MSNDEGSRNPLFCLKNYCTLCFEDRLKFNYLYIKGYIVGLDHHYKTGVLWQDLQHKELIGLLERLSNPNPQDSSPSIYTYSVAFLVMYTSQHFSLEEGYMEAYTYPDRELHQSLHKEFLVRLKEFRSKYPSYSPEAADILLKNILNWILNHILENDQKLGEFIIEKEKTLRN